MRFGTLLLSGLLVLGFAMPGLAADIQCKRILKNLSTGRTPEQVAETMVISVDDVIACQEEAEEAAEDTAKEAADDAAGK